MICDNLTAAVALLYNASSLGKELGLGSMFRTPRAAGFAFELGKEVFVGDHNGT